MKMCFRFAFLALLPVLGFFLAATPIARAQNFVNLHFEDAVVVPQDPMFGALDWNLAVPGWNHSTGTDTDYVYYGSPHLGASQYYLLNDFSLEPFSGSQLPIGHSLSFANGLDYTRPGSPFTQAFIAQTGLIPIDAQSLRLAGTGQFSVSFDGVVQNLIPQVGSAYLVDVSAHAGSVVELRIRNEETDTFPAVTVDSLIFSTTPIPEPGTLAIFFLGCLGFLWRWRSARP